MLRNGTPKNDLETSTEISIELNFRPFISARICPTPLRKISCRPLPISLVSLPPRNCRNLQIGLPDFSLHEVIVEVLDDSPTRHKRLAFRRKVWGQLGALSDKKDGGFVGAGNGMEIAQFVVGLIREPGLWHPRINGPATCHGSRESSGCPDCSGKPKLLRSKPACRTLLTLSSY
jgi:hypothetical protein